MTDWTAWLIVVPARLQSTRLPEKPLADLGGKPLVVRVYERLKPLAKLGAEIVVATDAAAVLKVCEAHGVPSILTSVEHKSGTDRCAEVAMRYARSHILNVQGDEPFVDLGDLETLIKMMPRQEASIGTLVHRNESQADFENPNCVKVIRDEKGQALYFSRAPIPYARAPARFEFFWQHLGVYAFHRDALLRFCSLPQHFLEKQESLEQLRALGHGLTLLTAEARHPAIGIDTPQDLEAARARFN